MKKSSMASLLVILLSLFLISMSSMLRADVLVLVHGWGANSNTWLQSGVLQALHRNGWSDKGVVMATPAGGVIHAPGYPISQHPQSTEANDNSVYRVELPAEAPLQIQAAHLFSELMFLQQRHSNEDIILAGHSAGGVVSRLVLVNQNAPKIAALITIASPNLGTERALQGLDIVYDKPFFCQGPGIDFLKETVGGDGYDYLKYSQGALVDLTPAVPGTLIGWLNQQPHPEIKYHSIIRQMGDELVPAFSQDLNQVPSLKGKSKVHLTPASHRLNPADGQLLASILD